MTTITASSTFGIDLVNYTNPLAVATGVTITNPGYPDAVYTGSGSTTAFTVTNYGRLVGSYNGALHSPAGVVLAPGGNVINAASASIAGRDGVDIYGGVGSAINSGSIKGTRFGVDLEAGGSVTNAASASIYGFAGIDISGVGSVTNEALGTIAGGNSYGYAGAFQAYRGVFFGSGAGTVVNAGLIAANPYKHNNIFSAIGIEFASGGTVKNAVGGTILGNTGIYLRGDGDIYGTEAVTNYGLIKTFPVSQNDYGYPSYYPRVSNGIVSIIPGLIVNESGGSIIVPGYAAKLYNAGQTMTNDGYISGGYGGIYLFPGSTLTNSGTVVTTGTAAIQFGKPGSGFHSYYPANRLILEPGFKITGQVLGDYGLIGLDTTHTNIIELTSYTSAGSISGIGVQFLHFNSIEIDPGAYWSVTGQNSLRDFYHSYKPRHTGTRIRNIFRYRLFIERRRH
jgi:fibronectin-binding autotransporter adhesin